jgi:sugar-specific transcriptional regulator TrmB
MQKIKLNDVKRYLKTLSKDELEKELLNVYKNFKDVKDYLSIKIDEGNSEEILIDYKNKILDEFFPDKGIGKHDFNNIRKNISNFKKVCSNNRQIVDLILYAVEQGVRYTNTYGDINENFYVNVGKLFIEAINHMIDNEIAIEYIKRCDKIVDDTSEVGWGFPDVMDEIFIENLSDYIDFEE